MMGSVQVCRSRAVRALSGNVLPLLAAALLALQPAIGRSQEFTADVVYAAIAGTPTSVVPALPARLFVSKEKMRLDFVGVAGQTLIVDDQRHETLLLMRARRTYQQLGSRPSEYFRVADAEHACPDWEQAVGLSIRCESVGREVIDGRPAIQYQRTRSNGTRDYVWIDAKLKYVIKWRADDTEAELRNVKEGAQLADWFEIPEGYEPARPLKSRSSTAPRAP